MSNSGNLANVTYQKFRDNYPGNLSLDVIKFRDNNQRYMHSNLKWFVSGVFNKFIQMST